MSTLVSDDKKVKIADAADNTPGFGLLEKRLADLSAALNRADIADFIALYENPKRMIFANFLGGLARGIGIAFGFTLIGALVVYLLQQLAILNLPIIGHFIAQLVRIINTELAP